MNESFSAFVRVLTAVLWGPHVLLLILLAGVWFTLRGRFMQVTKLPGMTRGALCGTQRCGGFSAFQSLTASLAGSLGTGNIFIAGMDGYTVNNGGNYFEQVLEYDFSDEIQARNAAIAKEIKMLRQKKTITFLTPTLYETN